MAIVVGDRRILEHDARMLTVIAAQAFEDVRDRLNHDSGPRAVENRGPEVVEAGPVTRTDFDEERSRVRVSEGRNKGRPCPAGSTPAPDDWLQKAPRQGILERGGAHRAQSDPRAQELVRAPGPSRRVGVSLARGRPRDGNYARAQSRSEATRRYSGRHASGFNCRRVCRAPTALPNGSVPTGANGLVASPNADHRQRRGGP